MMTPPDPEGTPVGALIGAPTVSTCEGFVPEWAECFLCALYAPPRKARMLLFL